MAQRSASDSSSFIGKGHADVFGFDAPNPWHRTVGFVMWELFVERSHDRNPLHRDINERSWRNSGICPAISSPKSTFSVCHGFLRASKGHKDGCHGNPLQPKVVRMVLVGRGKTLYIYIYPKMLGAFKVSSVLHLQMAIHITKSLGKNEKIKEVSLLPIGSQLLSSKPFQPPFLPQ